MGTGTRTFGTATRNGILLVTHYDQLMDEGLSLLDAVRRGSMERLASVLILNMLVVLPALFVRFGRKRPQPPAVASGLP